MKNYSSQEDISGLASMYVHMTPPTKSLYQNPILAWRYLDSFRVTLQGYYSSSFMLSGCMGSMILIFFSALVQPYLSKNYLVFVPQFCWNVAWSDLYTKLNYFTQYVPITSLITNPIHSLPTFQLNVTSSRHYPLSFLNILNSFPGQKL